MNEMKLTEIIGQKIAIHCPTEDDAKEVLRILHENGCEWYSGATLVSSPKWQHYQSQTAYEIADGRGDILGTVTWDHKSYFQDNNYTILAASDFIQSNS